MIELPAGNCGDPANVTPLPPRATVAAQMIATPTRPVPGVPMRAATNNVGDVVTVTGAGPVKFPDPTGGYISFAALAKSGKAKRDAINANENAIFLIIMIHPAR
jgi:hypothetical protein